MHTFKENVHVNPGSIMTELQGEGLPRLLVPGPAHQPPPAAPFLRQTLAHPQVRSACCSCEPHLDPFQKDTGRNRMNASSFLPRPLWLYCLSSCCWKLFSLLTSHLLEVLPLLFFLALLPHLLSITLLRSSWFLTWASWLASMSLYLWKPNLHTSPMFKTLYGPLIPPR